MYSQKNEDEHIVGFFEKTYGSDFRGTLLDIGANDGITLSNSRALIERGWNADLVEPAAIPFRKLKQLYSPFRSDMMSTVKLHELAIDDKVGITRFYESGSFLTKEDSGLVSTIVPGEKKRWWFSRVKFSEYDIQTVTFDILKAQTLSKTWDFISIDAEGKDWDILQQINLTEVGCKCLCIEHNSVETQKYIDYGKSHGMNVLLINNINVVLIKKHNHEKAEPNQES